MNKYHSLEMILTDLPISFTRVSITTILSCFCAKTGYGIGSLWLVKPEAIRAPSNGLFLFSSRAKLLIQKHESGVLTLQVSVIMTGDHLVVETLLPDIWVLLWKLSLYTVFYTAAEVNYQTDFLCWKMGRKRTEKNYTNVTVRTSVLTWQLQISKGSWNFNLSWKKKISVNPIQLHTDEEMSNERSWTIHTKGKLSGHYQLTKMS